MLSHYLPLDPQQSDFCQLPFKPMISHFARFTIVTLGLLLPHLASGQGAATERVYLSGTDKNNTVPWDFRVSGGRQAGVWTTIPVPSCWEMKGFGT